MSVADPYDLLRRAQEHGVTQDWLKDYDKLPGAKLSDAAIKLLADPHRSARDHANAKKQIEKLLAEGYLREVRQVHGFKRVITVLRRTPKGTAALRLRGVR